jgi:hypothetical protein
MIYKILLIKLKLYSRYEYDHKFKNIFKINYLLLVIPFYLLILHNIFLFNNFFYATFFYFLIIIGLDFHTVTNKSNLNIILIFNYLLDKNKSIAISFLAELLLKFSVFLPILFLVKSPMLLLLIGLNYISFSFFLKELICINIVSKKIYLALIFIYLLPMMLLGGPFLDFTIKQLRYIEYSKIYFYEMYITLLFVTIFFNLGCLLIYSNSYHKISE